jgi:hypothetical protein
VRPISKRQTQGYLQDGVETYGAGSGTPGSTATSPSPVASSSPPPTASSSSASSIHPQDPVACDSPCVLLAPRSPYTRADARAVDCSVVDGFKFNKDIAFVPVLRLDDAQLNAPAGADANAKAGGRVGLVVRRAEQPRARAARRARRGRDAAPDRAQLFAQLRCRPCGAPKLHEHERVEPSSPHVPSMCYISGILLYKQSRDQNTGLRANQDHTVTCKA